VSGKIARHGLCPLTASSVFKQATTSITAYHPWATKDKTLLALKGKTVEIVVTDKYIIVVAPRINLGLKRVHDDPVFRLDSCSHN
jgi:hypothetical protein